MALKILTIASKVIQKNMKKLAVFLAICALFTWVYAAFFPTIQEEVEAFEEVISAYPEGLMEAFGIQGDALFTKFEVFLGVEYFSIIWPIMLIILVVGLGASAVSEEVEEGTIELLLAQPMSRFSLYLAKLLGGIIVVILFVVISVAVAVPFASLYNIDINLESLATVTVLGLLFGLTLHSFAVFLSCMFSNRSSVTSVAAGVLILMYGLDLFASIEEFVEFLRYASWFYYFDYTAALSSAEISAESFVVFSASILSFWVAGLIVFLRRDIAT